MWYDKAVPICFVMQMFQTLFVIKSQLYQWLMTMFYLIWIIIFVFFFFPPSAIVHRCFVCCLISHIIEAHSLFMFSICHLFNVYAHLPFVVLFISHDKFSRFFQSLPTFQFMFNKAMLIKICLRPAAALVSDIRHQMQK